METKIKNLLARLAFFAEDGMAEPSIVTIAKDADALLKEMYRTQAQQAQPVAHSPIALQSIPKRQRDFTAENIRDIAHECMRIGDNEQAAVVFAIADALRDGNLTIHPAAVAVPDERCPHCCGSGVMPKAAIAPEPPDVPCRNCNGTGKVRRMLAAAPQATAEDSSAVLQAVAVPKAPTWYKRSDIVKALERMNYHTAIADELADWFLRHMQLAFNRGFYQAHGPAAATQMEELELWHLLERATGELTRRAAPHAWEQIAWRAGTEFIEQRRARLAAAPQAAVSTGWIDPNDKTQKQFLPHIGETVLFCHDGVTYYGVHTGGSFKTGQGVTAKTFGTWDCLWMYPPAAAQKGGAA